MRTGDTILGTLEGLWGQTQSMDSKIRVATCKTDNRRLLDEVFESKPIKRKGKIPFRQLKKSLEFRKQHMKQCLFPLSTTTLLLQHPPPPAPTFQGNLTTWTKPK